MLAAACCIWPSTEERRRAIQDAVSGGINWDLLLRVAVRQRVVGLVQHGLSFAGVSLPQDIAEELNRGAKANAQQALLRATETINLQRLFDDAGIASVFVKGVTLAQLAYGNVAVKHSWDIDALVSPRSLREANGILQRCGYLRVFPPASFDDARLGAWTSTARECVFEHERTKLILELHWRLTNNRRQLPHVSVASPVQQVRVLGGTSVRTLNDEDLFAYLCVHGALHGWSRLKWLADIGALLSQRSAENIEHLYRTAHSKGCGRAPAQCLLLCRKLFGMRLPDGIAVELRADRAAQRLVAIALDAMGGAGGAVELDDRPLGNLRIELSHFLLDRGGLHWLSELRAKLVGGHDLINMPLPPALSVLYPLLRMPSWAWRRASHMVRKPAYSARRVK